MIDEYKLRNNIRISLKAKGIDLSEKEIDNLYASAMSNIQSMLDNSETVEISEFGSFWRKKVELTTSVTFFKPIGRLLERINTSKK